MDMPTFVELKQYDILSRLMFLVHIWAIYYKVYFIEAVRVLSKL